MVVKAVLIKFELAAPSSLPALPGVSKTRRRCLS